jgi:hypothetical protein
VRWVWDGGVRREGWDGEWAGLIFVFTGDFGDVVKERKRSVNHDRVTMSTRGRVDGGKIDIRRRRGRRGGRGGEWTDDRGWLDRREERKGWATRWRAEVEDGRRGVGWRWRVDRLIEDGDRWPLVLFIGVDLQLLGQRRVDGCRMEVERVEDGGGLSEGVMDVKPVLFFVVIGSSLRLRGWRVVDGETDVGWEGEWGERGSSEASSPSMAEDERVGAEVGHGRSWSLDEGGGGGEDDIVKRRWVVEMTETQTRKSRTHRWNWTGHHACCVMVTA